MKTLLTTTAVILVMATTATASPKSCPVKTDTNGVQIVGKGCAAFVGGTGATGATGEQGAQGEQGLSGNDGLDGSQGLTGAAGTNGTNGTDGTNGTNGSDGVSGVDGSSGVSGADGDRGAAGVTPLGSLSFAAATSTFYGDGMGFGLSNSNYGSLEGSIVFGFDMDNDWRVVAGITTDFKGKTAGSIGVGVSF